MKLDTVQAIVRALGEAEVRFLVAGGLAVNAHGYHRFTKDLDLVVELDSDSVRSMYAALASLGYRPSVPITADQFADPELRETLFEEKGMRVLQFWSDEHGQTPVDVFVREPFVFEEEYQRADVRELAGVGSVRVVSGHPDTDEVGGRPARRPRGRPASPDATGGRIVKELPESLRSVDWEKTTWEGARREQLRRWAALPLDRIIASLEEMAELVDRMDGEVRRGRPGRQDPDAT